jgi:hypothetical protein
MAKLQVSRRDGPQVNQLIYRRMLVWRTIARASTGRNPRGKSLEELTHSTSLPQVTVKALLRELVRAEAVRVLPESVKSRPRPKMRSARSSAVAYIVPPRVEAAYVRALFSDEGGTLPGKVLRAVAAMDPTLYNDYGRTCRFCDTDLDKPEPHSKRCVWRLARLSIGKVPT